MSIATRTGDDGTTSLLYGQRVPKHHPQIEAVGACDELNAALGVAKAACVDTVQREQLTAIQHALVALMGEVACAESDRARYETSKFRRLALEDLRPVDAQIAELESRKLDFKGWATPGATLHSAALDVARTTCRRAERRKEQVQSRRPTQTPVESRSANSRAPHSRSVTRRRLGCSRSGRRAETSA